MPDQKTRLNQLDPISSISASDIVYIKKTAAEEGQSSDFKATMQQVKDFGYPPEANINTSGLVNTSTQSFAGRKTFNGGIAASSAEVSGQSSFSDDVTINGDLHLEGNLIQSGITYETEVETIAVHNEIIKTRDGATTGMAPGEVTGLEAHKYDGTHEGRLVFGADGVARVGDYTPASGNDAAVDDTQPLATREENPTDGALQVWDASNLCLKSIAKGTAGQVLTSNGPDSAPSFQALPAIALEPLANMLYPVGFVYTQYPGCPSPIDMNLIGTWQELKFGGMFFRSAGGNARDFTDAYAASVSGTTVTFTGDSIPYTGDSHKKDGVNVGDLIIAGSEYRTVTAVTTDGDYAVSVTIDSAFSDSTNITTVYIGQDDQLQGHEHQYSRWEGSSDFYGGNNYHARNNLTGTTTGIVTDGINGIPRVGPETRSKNITLRLWKRTA